MAEGSRVKGCFKWGCLGCAGLLGLFIVVTAENSSHWIDMEQRGVDPVPDIGSVDHACLKNAVEEKLFMDQGGELEDSARAFSWPEGVAFIGTSVTKFTTLPDARYVTPDRLDMEAGMAKGRAAEVQNLLDKLTGLDTWNLRCCYPLQLANLIDKWTSNQRVPAAVPDFLS